MSVRSRTNSVSSQLYRVGAVMAVVRCTRTRTIYKSLPLKYPVPTSRGTHVSTTNASNLTFNRKLMVVVRIIQNADTSRGQGANFVLATLPVRYLVTLQPLYWI